MTSGDLNGDTSVLEYIRKLSPYGWDLEQWLEWPPDTFALTSALLLYTGAYRYSVDPPVHVSPEECGRWPMEGNWAGCIEKIKTAWIKWVLGEGDADFPGRIVEQVEVIKGAESVTMGDLRRLNSGNLDTKGSKKKKREILAGENSEPWKVCCAILFLHALADETCAGFGTPSGITWIKPTDTGKNAQAIRAFHCIANVLLARTGSLSRLPRSFARILPKLRTPRVGLTLRSLSHHLTFHQTEVDILWRAMPWINIDSHTINALIVPLPFGFRATWFRPSSYTTPRASAERDSFFTYEGPNKVEFDEEFTQEDLLSLLSEAEKCVGRVHMIVFPELALTDDGLTKILAALLVEKKKGGQRGVVSRERDKIPMVLAGLREESGKDALGRNKAVLATFFAGRWYKMEQNKQHRWRLDEKQIQQYNLAGILPANRRWWEAIRIPERTLTVLAPNGWLGLSTLICEDLARLEPVSELIRGIGPTLLVALLLDGPQLSQRWPAKYAGVMADDPGSSVLTVSSLGMAQRSKPPNSGDMRIKEEDNGTKRDIAFWRDQVTGSKSLAVEGKGRGAVLLTLSAQWEEEVSADGRSDSKNAAVFVLQGSHSLKLDEARELDEEKKAKVWWAPRDKDKTGPTDLGEITIFTYFADAALDSPEGVIKQLGDWICDIFKQEDTLAFPDLKARDLLHKRSLRYSTDREIVKAKGASPEDPKYFAVFVEWLAKAISSIRAQWDDKWDHRKDGERKWESPEYIQFLELFVGFSERVLAKVGREEFFDQRKQGEVKLGSVRLNSVKINIPPVSWKAFGRTNQQHRVVRVYIYGCLAILWAVYKRLSYHRRTGSLTKEGAALMRRVQVQIKQPHDLAWITAKRKCEKLK